LPAVVDQSTAEAVHGRGHDDIADNVAGELEDRTGDVEATFAAAPHVERLHLTIERSLASPIEGRGIVADWDAARQRMHIWASTQAPVALKFGLCGLLDLTADQLQVEAPDVGGGFGSKIMVFYPEEILIPHAARQLARPVKWIEDR
jgi:CO/xanthine dehydrogenase Mo-binding subunit